MEKRLTGTREWAPHSKNICIGCKHDCKYCFSRPIALRYKWISDRNEWKNQHLNRINLDKKVVHHKEPIMFPTCHDIVPDFIEETIDWLHRWLAKGNKFLIVSKPHLSCVIAMCDTLGAFRNQILFRFTIGSADDKVLSFWEPNAPRFQERLQSLKYAYDNGYRTSISAEPFLGPDIHGLIWAIKPCVTDTIWIGKMNKISQRVDTTGWSKEDIAFLKDVEFIQMDGKIRAMYDEHKDDPKIRWKESIKEVLGLPSSEHPE